jgi:hypothetical protein
LRSATRRNFPSMWSGGRSAFHEWDRRSGSSAVVGATRSALIRGLPGHPSNGRRQFSRRHGPIASIEAGSQHEAPDSCTPHFGSLRTASYLGRSTGHVYEVLGASYDIPSTWYYELSASNVEQVAYRRPASNVSDAGSHAVSIRRRSKTRSLVSDLERSASYYVPDCPRSAQQRSFDYWIRAAQLQFRPSTVRVRA